MGKNAEELSEEYYRFVEKFTQSDFEDEKLLGKFYTNYGIAESMIRLIVEFFCKRQSSGRIRIIDPFCGDGRLVEILLRQLSESVNKETLYDISLWDIDREAVEIADKTIKGLCEGLGLKYRLESKVADAFVEYKKVSKAYDICVTNPPWSLLKPQKIFNKSKYEWKVTQGT